MIPPEHVAAAVVGGASLLMSLCAVPSILHRIRSSR